MKRTRTFSLVAVLAIAAALSACGPSSQPFAPDTPTSKLRPRGPAFDITTPPDGPCSDCGTPWNPPPPQGIDTTTTPGGGPPILPPPGI